MANDFRTNLLYIAEQLLHHQHIVAAHAQDLENAVWVNMRLREVGDQWNASLADLLRQNSTASAGAVAELIQYINCPVNGVEPQLRPLLDLSPFPDNITVVLNDINVQRRAYVSRRSAYHRFGDELNVLFSWIGLSLTAEGTTALASLLRFARGPAITWLVRLSLPIASLLPGPGHIAGPIVLAALASGALGPANLEGSQNQQVLKARYHVFHKVVKDLYYSRLQSLPRAIASKVGEVDDQIDVCIQQNQLTEWTHLLKRRQTILLGYPSQFQMLARPVGALPANAIELTSAEEASLTVRRAALLQRYGHVPAAQRILQEIIDRSLSRTANYRGQFYLYGPPGVGKTQFVNELAYALGVPMIEVRITEHSEFQLLAPAAGHAAQYNWTASTNAVQDINIMGIVPHALSVAGVLNPIIFVDEAHALLRARLGGETVVDGTTAALNLIFGREPTQLPTPSIATGSSYDTSRLTWILAANGGPPNDNPAMMQRLTSYEFPLLPVTVLREIVEQRTRKSVEAQMNVLPVQYPAISAQVLQEMNARLDELPQDGPAASAREWIAETDGVVASVCHQHAHG